MFSLFILLRTSLKTTFVKELPFFKNKYKRGARLHREGETASKRTQAFTLSKENDQRNNLPGCTVFSLDYQLHVTVDSFHYLKTFRRSDL